MSQTTQQATDLAGDLQRVLAKLITVVRRGDTATGRPDLTLAQVSILLTLLDSGPIRMTELATRERVRTPILFDVKSFYDPAEARAAGFTYKSL